MIHDVNLSLDWKLVASLSAIDRFEGAWTAIERREGQTLKQLKSIATVRSVGASTRIEGSKMNDEEVKVLIENLKPSNLEDRDAQEVAGYFETLSIISESYRDISLSENAIKGLHNTLMRHSDKDAWHRGDYKQLSNAVEARNELAGTKQIVFQPATPGHETAEGMRKLVEWYADEKETHPIVRSAIFVYDFLSIHPFQDGNGRLSRLITNLLLLKHGYSWIEFVSFEHEIEARKADYYQVLMECQNHRSGENVNAWVTFFLTCLSSMQESLMKKLETKGRLTQLTPRESSLYSFIDSHPGTRSGEISMKLRIPLPTVKRLLMDMVATKLLSKHGAGPGTHYYVEKITSVQTDLVFILNEKRRVQEFTILKASEFVEIKKLMLTPHFVWINPGEWTNRLINHGLLLKVKVTNQLGQSVELPTASVTAMISPTHYHPVFTLFNPIHIPRTFGLGERTDEYPIKCLVELISSKDTLDFDVSVLYDAALE